MCIPGRTQLSLTLPIKSLPPVPDVRTRELFAAACKELPRAAPQNWKFSVDDARDYFVLAANLLWAAIDAFQTLAVASQP